MAARSAKIYRHKDGVDIRGNLSVSGTTTLTGALTYTTLTLSGKLTANGDVDLGNAVGDAITVKGTANFDEAVTLDKTLGVTGAVTLTAGLTVGTTLAVTGATSLNGAVNLGDAVGDAVTCKGTANFDEAVTLDKTLGVTGASTLTGAVSCGATLAVTGAVTLSDDLSVAGNLGVTGALTAGSLSVAGTFTATDFAVTDDLTVGDDAAVAGDLTVTGGTVCNGDVDLGNAGTDTITMTGQVDSDIEFKASGNHGITGEADQVLFLNAAGTGHLYLGTAGDANAIEIEDGSGDVTVAQALNVAGAVTLDGDVTLGDAAGDTITITGQVAGNVEFTGASQHSLIGEADQVLAVKSAGSGHLYLGTAGDENAIEIEDTAGNVTVAQQLSVDGATLLNGDVTLGDAAGDTVTVTGQVAGSIEFTGAAQHNLIGEADQVLAVKSAGTGHLYLGTAGDENAIEIEDASGAVTVAQALTLSSTLALGGAVTTATGFGAAMTITGPTDQNLEVIAPASRQLVLKSNNATAITCDASSDVTVANDLTVSGGQLNVSGASGSQCSLKTKTATLDLSVAHSTTGGFIPEGAVVVGLVGRVLTELSGDSAFVASTWEIGTGDDTDGWGAALARAAGTEFDSADWVTETCNKLYTSADEVDFSETAGTANSGTIRIVLFYWQADAPTS